MLTPHIKDANRANQLARRLIEPDKFGGEPLQGEARVKAEKEIKRLNAEDAKAEKNANT